MRKKYLLVILFIVLSITIFLFLIAYLQKEELPLKAGNGRIIFQSKDSLMLIDGDGNHLQYLGSISGFSPTWSPDGKFIAIGCKDGTKICVLSALNDVYA